MRDATGLEPGRERQQTPRRGLEAGFVVGHLAAPHQARANRDEGGMHVETRALLM